MRIILLVCALATLFCAPLAEARPPARQGPAWTVAAKLHRGVNIVGYDPMWRDPAAARFKLRHLRTIKRGGFDFVRIVLQSFGHMDAQNRLDAQWLGTLDALIAAATAEKLTVILDEHDFDLCSADPVACEPRLTAFWRQIGERYRAAPDTVLFELLNEPHGSLDAATWNGLLARLVPVIRSTNPRRTLVIGPTRWNNLDELRNLVLPAADRNIIVTFHSYEPFRFTHQGAPWVSDAKDWKNVPFTAADAARIAADYDTVARWSKANDRPILLGEFGAYDRSGTPIAERARYTATVRREAEAHGFAWAYWQFDGDFIVYDIDHDKWVGPIHDALTP